MRSAAALAFSTAILFAQSEREPVYSVTAVRTWGLTDATRVAIEVSGPFQYKYDRLHDPERIYFDIKSARPNIEGKRGWQKDINDKLVRLVRVAENKPGVTRIVLTLSGPAEISPSQLTNPNRLMIELRPSGLQPAPPSETTAPPAPKPPVTLKTESTKVEPPRADPPARPETSPSPDVRTSAEQPSPVEHAAIPKAEPSREPVRADGPAEVIRETARPPVVKPEPAVKSDSPVTPAELAKAARRTTGGGSSLTRALGLKLNRVVLDAGHGGHDQGTQGPKGLLEKDLVLDVTQRLGKLIEQGLGAEVIYTRSDDTFIPLEGRTAIANEKKADLFLSIHANSSPYPKVTGVETYYLNFTDSKEAMDVASRENASSQKSVFELQDLIHKITLHEKLDESREFAARMQAALYAFSARSFPGEKNRGIKKAPFVVLIGAQMPSVLAEIGFISNPREEQLLRKPDYRQKLAESLYRGVSKYAESLSHFQLAQSK
jgi:N-acetylmuramoyl-L-alanine amidase